ncbi:hypothetical protein QTI66_16450 [Variovorax sp. J22R133]|uniref:hypothetical protein n=1 Tax=Variovorax brevis TaxID=3053503 RepID=UPI0025790954|nr:hypothetical protein [Variovorax sp. J22R133]MDM0113751.1 hypothetical protein [Variovorax sp. J22R133]
MNHSAIVAAPQPGAGSTTASAFWQTVARPEVIFLLAVATLAVRLLVISEPILMHDEYYYIKTAQLWYDGTIDTRAITSVPNRGEAGFPNALFFAIYQFTYFFGADFYAAGKLFNVFFASLAALAVASVARHFVTREVATWIAVLALWMPSTSFLPYFMPEALYECLTWTGIALLFSLYGRSVALAAVALGACLGAALLAKPNALAVLAACNLVLLCVVWKDGKRADRLRTMVLALVLLNVSFLLAGYVLNLLLTGHLHWDPLGKFYQNGLSRVAEVTTDRGYLHVFANYFFAYVFVIFLVFGPALIALGSGVFSTRLSNADVMLAAMTVLGVGVLLMGSVKVGVNWERVYVNHVGIFSSRYMSALFPLFFIAFARFLPDASANRRLRAWIGGFVVLACVALMAVRSIVNNWNQMREVFWPRALHPDAFRVVCALLVLTMLYYAFARAPRAKVYAGVMALWAFVSAAVMLNNDFGSAHAGDARRDANTARTVAGLVNAQSFDQGHVVSGNVLYATRFMSRFPGIVSLEVVKDTTAPVPRSQIPPKARWVVFLAGARPGFDANCIALKDATLCPLADGALYTNQHRAD